MVYVREITVFMIVKERVCGVCQRNDSIYDGKRASVWCMSEK